MDSAFCITWAMTLRIVSARITPKTGGRFVSLDACWVSNQGFLSRYIMSKDRGRNVRTEQAYRRLAGKVFKNVDAWVDTKPMRIPDVTVVLECQK
jgi:hypothetical protein